MNNVMTEVVLMYQFHFLLYTFAVIALTALVTVKATNRLGG